MTQYCSECGEELADVADYCPECGVSTTQGESTSFHTVLSYLGSAFLFLFALGAVSPVEGYQQWFISGLLFAVTGTLTLPPVKEWLAENRDIVIDRGSSWTTSIIGFMVGLYAVPT